jgi:hypothetical protein
MGVRRGPGVSLASRACASLSPFPRPPSPFPLPGSRAIVTDRQVLCNARPRTALFVTSPRLPASLRPARHFPPLAALLLLWWLPPVGGGLAAQGVASSSLAAGATRDPGLVLPDGFTVGIGTQLQFTGVLLEEPTPSDQSGFRIDNARVRLYGTLPRDLSWSLTSNYGSVIEARVSQRFLQAFQVDVGLFKPPVSGEYLTSSHSIDFTSRSRVMDMLIGGREAGVQLRWGPAGFLEMRGGVFNGDGSLRGEGEEGMLGVLRMQLRRDGTAGDTLRVGASLSRNGNPESVVGEGLAVEYPVLERTMAADIRWVRGRVVASAEWMAGALRRLPGDDPMGGHVTLGFRPGAATELLLRWDALETGGMDPLSSRLLVAGVSHRPTPELRFMVNARLPLDEPDQGMRFLVRSQLYF